MTHLTYYCRGHLEHQHFDTLGPRVSQNTRPYEDPRLYNLRGYYEHPYYEYPLLYNLEDWPVHRILRRPRLKSPLVTGSDGDLDIYAG